VALHGAPKVATKELAAEITTVIDWNNHLSYIGAAAFAGGLALCIVHPSSSRAPSGGSAGQLRPLLQRRRAAFFDLKNQHLN
jgi:hypothetical protein